MGLRIYRVQGLIRVYGLGFRDLGLGFRFKIRLGRIRPRVVGFCLIYAIWGIRVLGLRDTFEPQVFHQASAGF